VLALGVSNEHFHKFVGVKSESRNPTFWCHLAFVPRAIAVSVVDDLRRVFHIVSSKKSPQRGRQNDVDPPFRLASTVFVVHDELDRPLARLRSLFIGSFFIVLLFCGISISVCHNIEEQRE